jgi:DNA-binding NarL/FixJ family response regulator
MLGKFIQYRQIGDVENEYRSKRQFLNDADRRKLVPIAVIDDEQFVAEQTLKNNGYQIDVLGDIRELKGIAKYNIILCKKQGAYIIDEIKRNHPEKYVIAYTGGAQDDQITIAAQQVADSFLKKDADVEDWRDKLDEIISLLTNPMFVWRRQRFALVDADVPTLEILKLEDAFVRSLEQKSERPYIELLNKENLGNDLRAVAQSLIASGIFKALVG